MSPLKIVFVIVALATFVASQETYSDRFDDETDADSILANESERMAYFNCFMGRSACSPAAEYYSAIFPAVFVTQCKMCTEKQKQLFDTVATWYTAHQPDEWNAIVARAMELAKEKNIKAEK